MNIFHMYLCDICGYGREKPSDCPRCKVPLIDYTKIDLPQPPPVDMDQAIRIMNGYEWYV